MSTYRLVAHLEQNTARSGLYRELLLRHHLTASPGALINPLPSPKNSPGNPLTISLETKNQTRTSLSPSSIEKTRLPTSQAVTSLPFRIFSKVRNRSRDVFSHSRNFVSHRYFPLYRDAEISTGDNASRRNDDHTFRKPSGAWSKKATHYISFPFHPLA
ncbi:hypothetical protein AVEN_256078-1 [Araneus ventricosus]|uniref:Uncharacterized protein n=1 Tax=Araneus ventricosus TaxID=182803 RepID=A0A4Y2THE9_ARAVE|nr:hypothetical protein AVEN_256078-1 [Araneus ventricosus]